MRMVFVNPERCIGCRQCEFACAVEHSISKELTTAFLETPTPRARVHVHRGPTATSAFPNECRHCDPAPCEQVCPTGAIARDADGALVLVDPARCIGCAMCAVVCPFDVITFYPLAGALNATTSVAVKCDGCAERVARGDVPACVEVCKVDALVYGELNELIEQGRVRTAGAVLAAAGLSTPEWPEGDPLADWRSFGAAREDARLRARRLASAHGPLAPLAPPTPAQEKEATS
ncbi:MAG TPA: 4Fe-4S dicluster domain-containing protein [Acidimicrobiales bacterium]|nr:4Fe-4S dicluster domain-containing protein [Acidimicrobiales bacterium]